MAVDRERLRAELRQMRVLIEKDPEVRARFDADGNGMIDGHEWEQVRQLVIRRLEREQAEEAEARRLAARTGETGGATAAAAPGAVAQGIYEDDLRGSGASAAAIGDADELVLEQQGGLSQLLEGLVRRRYAVFAADGTVLGAIEQVENELLQDLTNRSLFEEPDLHFRVTGGSGLLATFRRSEGLARDGIGVSDASGRPLARVDWKLSLLGKRFAVEPAGEGGAVTVKGSLWHPFSYAVLDCVDDPIGTLERGWTGLGAFLTGGNRMRIRLEPGQATPEQRWGLLAAALLADLGAEDRD